MRNARLGAREEVALAGRRAPGVDALEDAKPAEVRELELQAVQSLVTGGVPRRRAALHLERLLHSLAAGVLRLLRLLGGHDACARVDSTAVAAPLERCLRVPLALELDAGGVASRTTSAPRCDRARDRDPTRPTSEPTAAIFPQPAAAGRGAKTSVRARRGIPAHAGVTLALFSRVSDSANPDQSRTLCRA